MNIAWEDIILETLPFREGIKSIITIAIPSLNGDEHRIFTRIAMPKISIPLHNNPSFNKQNIGKINANRGLFYERNAQTFQYLIPGRFKRSWKGKEFTPALNNSFIPTLITTIIHAPYCTWRPLKGIMANRTHQIFCHSSAFMRAVMMLAKGNSILCAVKFLAATFALYHSPRASFPSTQKTAPVPFFLRGFKGVMTNRRAKLRELLCALAPSGKPLPAPLTSKYPAGITPLGKVRLWLESLTTALTYSAFCCYIRLHVYIIPERVAESQ